MWEAPHPGTSWACGHRGHAHAPTWRSPPHAGLCGAARCPWATSPDSASPHHGGSSDPVVSLVSLNIQARRRHGGNVVQIKAGPPRGHSHDAAGGAGCRSGRTTREADGREGRDVPVPCCRLSSAGHVGSTCVKPHAPTSSVTKQSSDTASTRREAAGVTALQRTPRVDENRDG